MVVLCFGCAGSILSHIIFLEVLFISSKELLINDEIKASQVRMIGSEGEQLGIMTLEEAKTYAYDKGVDLVMMAPNAQPPVCRAMDYGKFRFDRDKKEKEARKKQQIIKVKEVKLSCRIDTHDFNTRVNQARKFLEGGDKVKAIVVFKGREMTHLDIGREMLDKFISACEEYGATDKKPVMEGRFMSVVISPIKADKKAQNKNNSSEADN